MLVIFDGSIVLMLWSDWRIFCIFLMKVDFELVFWEYIVMKEIC